MLARLALALALLGLALADIAGLLSIAHGPGAAAAVIAGLLLLLAMLAKP